MPRPHRAAVVRAPSPASCVRRLRPRGSPRCPQPRTKAAPRLRQMADQSVDRVRTREGRLATQQLIHEYAQRIEVALRAGGLAAKLFRRIGQEEAGRAAVLRVGEGQRRPEEIGAGSSSSTLGALGVGSVTSTFARVQGAMHQARCVQRSQGFGHSPEQGQRFVEMPRTAASDRRQARSRPRVRGARCRMCKPASSSAARPHFTGLSAG